MTAALTSLAADVKALQDTLATAATAAEVAALQTALTAAQSDLTELLASNNVYSNNLTINSQATLDVAKSLGGKLAIINGGVTITQSSSMDAEDLQAVVDVMVTVTGSITYTMDVNGSTQAVFNNLTSVGGLNVDVSGAINFPELQNAGAVVLEDTHKNYVTSVEFPKLSKVTSFATASAANTISFSKATAITLTELANYANASLTLAGKLDFALDLGKITSKTAAGVKNAIHLTINGAKEVILPEFTEGQIDADSTEKVVLAKYEGNAGDSFAKAEYLHLEVYERDYTSTSTSLDTLIFGGVAEASDTTSAGHPTLNLTGATGLTDLTVKGKLNDLILSGNTSLTDVDVTGTINDVTVSGATSLETLVLGHTGSPSTLDEASLTITNNTELSSLTVDSLVNADTFVITGNTSLETVSFAKMAGVGIGTVITVDISNNNLSATSVEKDTAGATAAVVAAGGTGSIVSTSGIKTLKTYLGVAAGKATTAGSSVYAAFDNVETYIDTDDSQSGPFTYTVASGKGLAANAKLEIVYITPATSDVTVKDSYAEALTILDSDSGSNSDIILTANGSSVTVSDKLSSETASAFLTRVAAASLPNATVSTGVLDRRAAVAIGTSSTTATSSATIIFGSAGYSSATATPTVAANSKVVVEFTNSATEATAAANIATALNSTGTVVYMQSFNSTTYSNTGNYTTTTTKFSDLYAATNEGAKLVIAKKRTVITDPVTSATATSTVLDRTASAVTFTLFDSSTGADSPAQNFSVTANSYEVMSNYYVKITDNLFGTANTPAFGITQGTDFTPATMATDIHMDQVIEEEFSAYSATTGAGTTRTASAAWSGNLTRETEFSLESGVDANKKNITSWL